MTVKGIDHAEGLNPPSPAAIRADGNAFVYRYVAGAMVGSGSSWPKCITKTELQSLWAGGLSVGLVFERGDGRDYLLGADGHAGGYAGGQYWARQQQAVNAAIGWPDVWPIVIAADWDYTLGGYTQANPPSPGEQNCQRIAEFLRGWATILAEPGLYGGYFTLDAVKRLHPQLVLGWQTVAWSYLNRQLLWQPWAQIHQMVGTHYVAGVGCDVDYAFGEPSGLHGGAAPPGPFDTWPVLVQGSSDPRVVSWEKVLNAIFAQAPIAAYRALPKLPLDGVFSQSVTDRTKLLQQIGQIAQDGKVGPATYRAALYFGAQEKIDYGKL